MNKILILLYHRILSKEDDLSAFKAEDRVFSIKEEDFVRQLEYLYINRWNTIYLAQLINHLQDKTPLPEKSVIISFDDGNLSDYTVAFPLLKKNAFKASFFITTNLIDKSGYLNKSQILEISNSGMEFGSHGKSHRFLPTLNKEEMKTELEGSKKLLEEITKKEINLLSLPGGYYSPSVKRVAGELGYKGICTSEFGWNEIETDPCELSRVSLSYGDSFTYYISLVNLNKQLYFNKKLKGKALGLIKTLLGANNYFRLWSFYQRIVQKINLNKLA